MESQRIGMGKRWMIYGANGYTGTLVAELAVKRGLLPVLAGRNGAAVSALARRFGFEHRVFGLDDPQTVRDALRGINAVAHLAGPFIHTSAPMVDACLAVGAHYLDITGEFPVFDAIANRDAEAKAAGVSLVPGVGFDVVPTDCLAARLAGALPDAVELELAFSGTGSISRGTLKTMLENFGEGSKARINGILQTVPYTWRTPTIPFPSGQRDTVTVPWGDISTAYRSTGIPNIAVYFPAPASLYRVVGALGPILGAAPVKRSLQWIVQRTVVGPDARTRARGHSEFWGRVRNAAGKTVTATMTSQEAYTLTADSTIKAVWRVLAGDVPAGALTPSLAFGPDFVQTLEGVTGPDLVVT